MCVERGSNPLPSCRWAFIQAYPNEILMKQGCKIETEPEARMCVATQVWKRRLYVNAEPSLRRDKCRPKKGGEGILSP